MGSSKASTHGDKPFPPTGRHSDLSSAPGAAAPRQRVIQTHTGASPGFWVGISATSSSCRESMATTPGTIGAACPPCWAGSVGTGEEELEQFGKKQAMDAKIKFQKRGERSSFTFCSCNSSVQANLVGGGKGKKAGIPYLQKIFCEDCRQLLRIPCYQLLESNVARRQCLTKLGTQSN